MHPPVAAPCVSGRSVSSTCMYVSSTRATTTSHTQVVYAQGKATYFDVVVGDTVLSRKAWSYEQPTSAFAPIAGYLAFYPHPPLECFVDGEQVQPQPGSFYGGWVTSWITGMLQVTTAIECHLH